MVRFEKASISSYRPSIVIFTARCTIVPSAVLRLHVVCLSLRPYVCDVGGSGAHRLEFLETNCKNNSNLCGPDPPTSQTDRGTDGQTDGMHRAVKITMEGL